ncbi:MAG: hypothetical protein HY984_00350 [Candidatus Magasanikbacteria bacterium]|nr:hypothetical protein [Candidatus Magasanikbacteria bacterium]
MAGKYRGESGSRGPWSREGSGAKIDPRVSAAELRRDMPKLDLHTTDPLMVEGEVVRFVEQYREDKNVESIEIVYGIGKGVLRRITFEALRPYQDNGIILDVYEGNGGSCTVIFDK